jgi:iduronate 2-sulfatase
MPEGGILTGAQAAHLRHGYYAAISYVDAMIGRLMAEVELLGLDENTVICLWGDHGWHLGEHGLWCKTTNFELDTRAPLIFAVPGQATAGRSSRSLAEFTDIYPTLVELCGLPAADGLEGRSLAPVLETPSATVRTSALSQFPRGGTMGYSLRTDRWRYTEWIDRRSGLAEARELYDHGNDPAETINLAGRTDHARTVARLSAELRERIGRGNGH